MPKGDTIPILLVTNTIYRILMSKEDIEDVSFNNDYETLRHLKKIENLE